jgi:DNA-binding HxlR family transcriptional regulator
MARTSFRDIACSIARTLDVVGEWWTPLILRDVYVGITRFDALQHNLGLSRKVLADRLHGLLEDGVLERRAYQDNPTRYDYSLTPKGEELVVLIMGLMAWGDRWADEGQGPPVILRHEDCGHATHPHVACSACGEALRADAVSAHPGPGARSGPVTRDIGAAIARRWGAGAQK